MTVPAFLHMDPPLMTMVSDNQFDETLFQEDKALLHPDSPLRHLTYGQCSADESAIVGGDNMLFIHSGSNRWADQISGSLTIGDADLARSCSIIADAEAKCHARGTAFVVAVVPEKDVIYPEFSPSCAGVPLSQRSVHQLIAAMPQVIYPWADLIGHKHLSRVYHRFDSHFNAAGGMVVTNAVLRAADLAPLDWAELSFTHVRWQDDLSLKWEAGPLHRRTLVNVYREEVLAKGNPLTGTHIAFTLREPRHSRSAIVFGDSYSWNIDAGIARLLLYRFDTVHFVWSRAINWELVDAVRPELIIMESAERFIVAGLVRA